MLPSYLCIQPGCVLMHAPDLTHKRCLLKVPVFLPDPCPLSLTDSVGVVGDRSFYRDLHIHQDIVEPVEDSVEGVQGCRRPFQVRLCLYLYRYPYLLSALSVPNIINISAFAVLLSGVVMCAPMRLVLTRFWTCRYVISPGGRLDVILPHG